MDIKKAVDRGLSAVDQNQPSGCGPQPIVYSLYEQAIKYYLQMAGNFAKDIPAFQLCERSSVVEFYLAKVDVEVPPPAG